MERILFSVRAEPVEALFASGTGFPRTAVEDDAVN
jgi:hypothetical protein